MINAFSSRSNLNTKSSLKIKPCDRTINYESFSPKSCNSSEISKVVSCSIFFILTHAWGINILFEKLRSETRG